jgi:hypothetical protein
LWSTILDFYRPMFPQLRYFDDLFITSMIKSKPIFKNGWRKKVFEVKKRFLD